MRIRSKRRWLLPVLFGALLLVACSDDDDNTADESITEDTGAIDTGVSDPSAEEPNGPPDPSVASTAELPIGTEEDLREALAASIASGAGAGAYDEPTTECLVTAIIDGIGYERLIELGVRPGNVDDIDPVLAMTDDEREAYIDALGSCTSLRDLAIQSLGFAPPLDQCIEQSIPDEQTARAVLLFLISSPDTTAPPSGVVGEVYDSLEICQSELLDGALGD